MQEDTNSLNANIEGKEHKQLIETLNQKEHVIVDLNDPGIVRGWLNPFTGESGTF